MKKRKSREDIPVPRVDTFTNAWEKELKQFCNNKKGRQLYANHQVEVQRYRNHNNSKEP